MDMDLIEELSLGEFAHDVALDNGCIGDRMALLRPDLWTPTDEFDYNADSAEDAGFGRCGGGAWGW